MPIPANVTAYLTKHKVKHDIVPHRTVFTVYDLAQTLKVKLNTIVKTLLIKSDQGYHLAVLPAQKRLDIAALKKALGFKKVSIANEKDMQTKFKVKPGAMTPFGAMHKVGVVIDRSLVKTEKMLFGAGSFTESVRMKMKDYLRLEDPTVANISTKK
ncbi:MAG: YbaK/EbsC family protein [Candidatus Kerfeldbacteria bacterium]|nr:YbaK/EbsC family protein [Candidatus Kerfeldbacteria bacterium]